MAATDESIAGLIFDRQSDGSVIVYQAGVAVLTIGAGGSITLDGTTDFTFTSEARGDILRRGASAWERHAAKTSGQILVGDGTDIVSVAVSGDVALSSAGAATVTDLTLTSEARGDVVRRNASAWGVVSAKTSGQVLLGDGTDVISAALSGDVSAVSAAGSVTLANPQRTIEATTVNLTNTTIVGNSAGDLGHAAGVTLVAAVASKIIEPIAIVINFTFATAAYTDGGNVSAKYSGGVDATGVCSAANSFGAAASKINVLRPLSGLSLVNTDLVLVAASAFTDPGTAVGTAAVKTYYRLIDA